MRLLRLSGILPNEESQKILKIHKSGGNRYHFYSKEPCAAEDIHTKLENLNNISNPRGILFDYSKGRKIIGVINLNITWDRTKFS